MYIIYIIYIILIVFLLLVVIGRWLIIRKITLTSTNHGLTTGDLFYSTDLVHFQKRDIRYYIIKLYEKLVAKRKYTYTVVKIDSNNFTIR